jgi:hypothetical protein
MIRGKDETILLTEELQMNEPGEWGHQHEETHDGLNRHRKLSFLTVLIS